MGDGPQVEQKKEGAAPAAQPTVQRPSWATTPVPQGYRQQQVDSRLDTREGFLKSIGPAGQVFTPNDLTISANRDQELYLAIGQLQIRGFVLDFDKDSPNGNLVISKKDALGNKTEVLRVKIPVATGRMTELEDKVLAGKGVTPGERTIPDRSAAAQPQMKDAIDNLIKLARTAQEQIAAQVTPQNIREKIIDTNRLYWATNRKGEFGGAFDETRAKAMEQIQGLLSQVEGQSGFPRPALAELYYRLGKLEAEESQARIKAAKNVDEMRSAVAMAKDSMEHMYKGYNEYVKSGAGAGARTAWFTQFSDRDWYRQNYFQYKNQAYPFSDFYRTKIGALYEQDRFDKLEDEVSKKNPQLGKELRDQLSQMRQITIDGKRTVFNRVDSLVGIVNGAVGNLLGNPLGPNQERAK